MITKKRKRAKSWQVILFSAISALIIFGVIGFLVVSNLRMNQRRAELTSRIQSLRGEIQTLEQKKQVLENLSSESEREEYLETVAREQLNLKKPGEEVVSVLPPETEKVQEEILEEKTFWQKLLEKIGF